jgi:hypothetical protein
MGVNIRTGLHYRYILGLIGRAGLARILTSSSAEVSQLQAGRATNRQQVELTRHRH